MPVTPLDRAIPFAVAFIVPYVSFFLLILTPLLVVEDPQELRDVAFGFGLIVVVSSVAFLLWPTILSAATAKRMTLLAFDTERNACPSLHASLALYCALCVGRHIQSAICKIRTLDLDCPCNRFGDAHQAPCRDRYRRWSRAWLGGLLGTVPPGSRGIVRQPAVLETLRIRSRLVHEMPDFDAMTRHDGRERAREFAIFVALATLGFCLSISARTLASAPMLACGILLTAVALNSFPLLMHEGMHGMLFPNRPWNWIVSVLLGSTFLMSFTSYRVLHIRHHQYLGDPRDPR